MPVYICPRCRYSTKIKTHMTNHFNRKKPCESKYNSIGIPKCIHELNNITSDSILLGVSDVDKNFKNMKPPPPHTSPPIINPKKQYICGPCGKVFTRRDNLKRHQRNCTGAPGKNNVYTKSEVVNLVENMNEEYDKKDRINQAIIKELRNQIGLLMQNQGSNITYNTSIMLNAFGQETTNYIDNNFIDKLVQKGPINSISMLLRHIHFNPDHTENHNIMIPNKKSTFAKIFNGHNWQISDRKQTIADMTDKAYAMINEHYNGGSRYMDTFKNNYDSPDLTVNKKIHRDTEIMILNNQKPK